MNQTEKETCSRRSGESRRNERVMGEGEGKGATYLLQYAPQSQQLLLELQHILDHGIPEGFVIQHQIVRRAVQLRVASSVSNGASRARRCGRQLLLLVLLASLQTRRG